jgi:uncharacterized protein YkwD
MRKWLILPGAALVLTACQAQTTPTARPAASQQEAGQAPATQQAPPVRKATAAPKPAAAKSSAPARPAPSTVGALATPSRDEQTIFDLANRERAARNLPPLKWSAGLATAARAHAQKMAQAGTLSHQFAGEMDMGMRIRVAGVRFTSAAENVAQGPSAAAVHQEWMNSPGHRDNLLDPELNSLGVAVVERNGQLFAVQDFVLATP